ncbi:MAG: hypothetical protein NZ772_04055 [Cyanobacteria bacterium]|nr:hypothetical protein [Cyanobacteriota bacterium]MDW8200598.1 hypothetical protein [Cyanobacteriota bacterium SKYGB_h_bin112]
MKSLQLSLVSLKSSACYLSFIQRSLSAVTVSIIALLGMGLPLMMPSLPVLADDDDRRSAHPKACERDYVLPNGSLDPHRGHFSLAINQRQVTLPEVIARVSIMAKRPDGYLNERFIGDFRYKMNQRAKFIRGVNPGDRVIVRLFTTQQQLIGYSAFELLPDNAAVHLVLSSNPLQTRVVRTVYGFDANEDGVIDTNRTSYSYFTQVTGANWQTSQVTFLKQVQAVNVSMFQIAGLPNVSPISACSCSFSRGRFALLDRTLLVFSPGLAPALVSLPGQTVQVITVSDRTLSIYEVSRQVVTYQQVGFTTGTMTELIGVVSGDDDDDGRRRRRRNCNQGIGNGPEGCDPGNSRPRGGSNDEGGRRPGRNR